MVQPNPPTSPPDSSLVSIERGDGTLNRSDLIPKAGRNGTLTANAFDPTRDPMGIVIPQLQEWQERLREAGVRDFRFGSGGAIPAGHFDGIKDRSHSTNVDCPYPYVMEFDGRIFISNDQDPHDQTLVRKIADATGMKYDPPATCRRWNADVPLTRMFFYSPVDGTGKVGFEYEMCLLREGEWLETTDYWHKIFTTDEIRHQKELRAQLRARGAVYDDVYVPVKNGQNLEAVWRIVALYALGEWLKGREHLGVGLPSLEQNDEDRRNLIPKLIKPGDNIPALARPRVEAWLAGERGGDGLDRPHEIIPETAAETVLAYAPYLVDRPREPLWVAFASLLQKRLQHLRANGGSKVTNNGQIH